MLDMFRNENFLTQVIFPRWHCDELFQPSHCFPQYIFDHHIAAKYFRFVTASFLILDKKLNLKVTISQEELPKVLPKHQNFLNRFEIVATKLNRNILDDLLIIIRKLKIF